MSGLHIRCRPRTSQGQPPAVLGGMIGSALVGTFLGILLAYGIVEPLGGPRQGASHARHGATR